MPNIKSAIKRVKTSEKQRLRNKSVKTALKTQIKRFEAVVAEENPALAEITYRNTSHSLDKAASKGVIHKNTAARKKSRLHKKLAALGSNTEEA